MDEKLRILEMVENNEITVEEGLKLMEALEKTECIKIPSEELQAVEIPTSEKDVTVDVTLVSSDVELVSDDVEKFEVMFINPKTRAMVEKPEWITITATEESLSIGAVQQSKQYNGISGLMELIGNGFTTHHSLNVKVKIPKTFGVNLKAVTVSGDIVMDGISGDKCYVKTISGDVNMENTIFRSNELYTTSGDFKGGAIVGYIEGKSVSGDFHLTLEEGFGAKSSNIKTVSGDISVQLNHVNDLEIDLSTVSGEIYNKHTEAKLIKDGRKSSRLLIGEGEHKIHVKTVSGDVRVK